jgi:hypothetical protein
MIEKDMATFTLRHFMAAFAEATGLSSKGEAPRRYLWTDAFAVCNFLELYRRTSDEQYKQLALQLVDQVHSVLGRYHEEDPRSGWISGLDEQQRRLHPTKGGLRIGKLLRERGPDEVFDQQLEWDRDGQYYHYLTKWMHALNRVGRVTSKAIYTRWAIELAKTAHAGFTYIASSGHKRLYWKMSTDLSYPVVTSMGQHDPLDGFITYNELQATATRDVEKSDWLNLQLEVTEMADICEGRSWDTDDPLGIGGLLSDAYKMGQLLVGGYFEQAGMLEDMLHGALAGLASYAMENSLNLPADYRLAFRELGLSIGLRAVEKMQVLLSEDSRRFAKKHDLQERVETLMRYAPLAEIIETFWLEPAHRESSSWVEHPDINMIMLATSLAPDGYLTI